MPNDNSSNGNGSSVDVHLVLNGKGGVGKSVVAPWLAEFLSSRPTRLRRSCRCKKCGPRTRDAEPRRRSDGAGGAACISYEYRPKETTGKIVEHVRTIGPCR